MVSLQFGETFTPQTFFDCGRAGLRRKFLRERSAIGFSRILSSFNFEHSFNFNCAAATRPGQHQREQFQTLSVIAPLQ